MAGALAIHKTIIQPNKQGSIFKMSKFISFSSLNAYKFIRDDGWSFKLGGLKTSNFS